MTDTNEAFLIIRPEGCATEEYQKILLKIRDTFDIKSAWGRMPDTKSMEKFKLENKKCICMILSAKEGQSLEKIKEVAKELPVIYATTVKEVSEQIALWRPKFISNPNTEGEE